MKITGTGPLRSTPIQRRERSGGASSTFRGELREESKVRSSGGGSEVSAVNALLSIQEIGDFEDGRRQAVRRGEDLLERLDELRHGLLIGAFPKEKLDQLLVTVRRQHAQFSDPRLREVLQEIELRAMVELAKLGRAD